MAKDVLINGVTYAAVPYVDIPLAPPGSGNAKFVDTDSGDAAAGDIRSGKKAWADGIEVTGNIPERNSSDVTAVGKNVSIPAGIYDAPVTKPVADGSVTPSAVIAGDEIGDTVSDYPVTATPSAAVTAGYISAAESGAPITKYIQVEDCNVTPSDVPQTILATAGKLIKRVLVAAVNLTASASESDVLSGKTFFSGSLTRRTGTATVPTVSQDSTTKVLTIV